LNKMNEMYIKAIETYLAAYFSENDALSEAMRYSLLAGGKRIRPILCLEFCRLCGGDWEKAIAAACGVEMLHCYSLIHDDLPCMDNDDMRRGQPSCHIAFGETKAVLAGDCLQAEAFVSVSRAQIGEVERFHCMSLLAEAAGLSGICGGQMEDLLQPDSAEAVLATEYRKTAVLIAASCAMGAAAAGADESVVGRAKDFGIALGMAFQLRDDVLDGDGYCALAGEPACTMLADEYTQKALGLLSDFENIDFLQMLTVQLAGRKS